MTYLPILVHFGNRVARLHICQFWYILEGLGTENFNIFHCPWGFGIFFRFGLLCLPRKKLATLV
jgi:hypothetical protein